MPVTAFGFLPGLLPGLRTGLLPGPRRGLLSASMPEPLQQPVVQSLPQASPHTLPLCLALAACAVLVLPWGAPVRRRRARPTWPRRARAYPGARDRAHRDRAHRDQAHRDQAHRDQAHRDQAQQDRAGPVRRRLAHRGVMAAGGMLCAGLFLGVPVWLVLLAGAAAGAAVVWSGRRESPLTAPQMRGLAGTLDLFGTCLDAGLPVGHALTAVLRATQSAAPGTEARDGSDAAGRNSGLRAVRRHGPTGPVAGGSAVDRRAADRATPDRATAALREVAALLTLGADAPAAWAPARHHAELAALAAAAERSQLGGVRLADAAREVAEDLRGRCRRRSDRGAARAGVAMTAPLALCFLPAFICLGLAPVVIGLIGGLHLW